MCLVSGCPVYTLGNLFICLNQSLCDGHVWETLLASVGVGGCHTPSSLLFSSKFFELAL